MDDLAFLRVDLTFHGHWHSFQVQCEAILAMKRPAAGIRRPAAAKAAALPAADDVVRTYPNHIRNPDIPKPEHTLQHGKISVRMHEEGRKSVCTQN